MQRLEGIFCPLVTPLDREEELDEPALRAQLRRVCENGDGLLLLGTTGELPLLQGHVADRLTHVTLECVSDDITVVLGIGDAGTVRARANLLRRCPERVNYVAACGPYYYNDYGADSYLRHFRALADASRVPVVLYNIPQYTHSTIPLDVIAELAVHENVAGVKDSSGDMQYFKELLELQSAGFSVLQGSDEAHASEYFRMGCAGYVSGLENLLPGVLAALRQAIERSDAEGEADAAGAVATLLRLLSVGHWLVVLKAAVGMLTGGAGVSAAPLPTLSAQQRRRVVAGLRELTLAVPDPVLD